MKNLLPVCFVMLFALTGCKKDNSTPIPTATTSYAGEYALSGTETSHIDGKSNVTSPNSATLQVFMGNKPNTYYFLENLGVKEVGYYVTVNGTEFTITPYYDELIFDNDRWLALTKGSGRFENGRVVINKSNEGYNIQNLSDTVPYKPKTHDIKKQFDFVGTKK